MILTDKAGSSHGQNIPNMGQMMTNMMMMMMTTSIQKNHKIKVTILKNQQVRTDRTTANNKPDIIIHDNKQGTSMSIDIAIPGDRNVIKREAEKIIQYKDLIIEFQCMWNVDATVIADNNSRGNCWKWDVCIWTGLDWLRIETVGGRL